MPQSEHKVGDGSSLSSVKKWCQQINVHRTFPFRCTFPGQCAPKLIPLVLRRPRCAVSAHRMPLTPLLVCTVAENKRTCARTHTTLFDETPSPKPKVEMCARGEANAWCQPQSHNASGWGTVTMSQMGTLSRGIMSRPPPPLAMFEPAPSTPNPVRAQPTHPPMHPRGHGGIMRGPPPLSQCLNPPPPHPTRCVHNPPTCIHARRIPSSKR